MAVSAAQSSEASTGGQASSASRSNNLSLAEGSASSSVASSHALGDAVESEFRSAIYECLTCLGGFALVFILKIIQELPPLAHDKVAIGYLVSLLSTNVLIAVTLFGVGSVFVGAVKELRRLHISRETLEALAVGLAVAYQIYGLFWDIDALSNLPIYGAPIAVLAAVSFLRVVEFTAADRASKLLGVEFPSNAKLVKLVNSDGVNQIPAREAREKDLFEVNKGEVIPLDGEIVRGMAEVLELRYGGCPSNRIKREGQGVYAGSTVLNGSSLIIRAASTQEDSVQGVFVSGLNRVLSEFRNGERVQTALRIVALAGIFLAACSVLFWNDRGASVSQLVSVAESVLLSVLAIQGMRFIELAPGIAITKLFRQGITLRDASAFRRAAKIRNLALEASSTREACGPSVSKFEVLDDRLNEKKLIGVLLSLFGDSDDPVERPIYEALRAKIDVPDLVIIGQYHQYPGRGAIGLVENLELTVGSEAFLLERGVEMQPSDALKMNPGEEVIYVAMCSDVVARFVIKLKDLSITKDAVSTLNRAGVRVRLIGQESVELVDSFAKECGIERAASIGGVTGEALKSKLSEWKPVGFYSREPRLARDSGADLSITEFHELLWNERLTDVTLYDLTPKVLPKLILSAKRCQSIQTQIFIPVLALGVMIVGASFFAIYSPALVAVTVAGILAASLLRVSSVS